jgi:branched-subunit amino acid aminotransferase/4-amino-4-deoxychorismate lyase
MIWAGGQVVPDEAMAISVLDRTFEHGLGLFETLRTWGRRALLLDRHLARLRRSAEALRLPLDPGALPDDAAVASLLGASGLTGDVMLRITMTGGRSEEGGAVLWMRAAPLPSPVGEAGAGIVSGRWAVDGDEALARHKALNYWSRRLASERARARGADEMLNLAPDGRIWEGSRTNVFAVRGGTLLTPGLDAPIVPGIMRGLVVELAGGEGLAVREGDLTRDPGLATADEVFLTNSVRGIIPVGREIDGGRSWPRGPITRRLQSALAAWIGQQGGTP